MGRRPGHWVEREGILQQRSMWPETPQRLQRTRSLRAAIWWSEARHRKQAEGGGLNCLAGIAGIGHLEGESTASRNVFRRGGVTLALLKEAGIGNVYAPGREGSVTVGRRSRYAARVPIDF